MNCFVHLDQPAVGVCIACGRAVCPECAADLQRAIACKERCENEVRRMLDIRDFSFTQPSVQKLVLERSTRGYLTSGLFSVVFGITALAYSAMNPRLWWIAVPGAMVLLHGVMTMITGRKRPQAEQFRLCTNCGYNVTGNKSGKCPECGHFI